MRLKAILLVGGWIVLVGGLEGCRANGQSRTTVQVKGIKLVRSKIDEAAKQMDLTIGSLQSVVAAAGTDPVPVYSKFVADVKSLDSQVEELRSSAAAMRSGSENYFLEWDAKVQASIKNPDIAKKSAERRAAVQQRVESLRETMEAARESYAVIASDLHDIVSYLDIDLNQAGIQSIAGEVDKIKQNSQGVHSALDAIRVRLREVGESIGAMSPPPPESPPFGAPAEAQTQTQAPGGPGGDQPVRSSPEAAGPPKIRSFVACGVVPGGPTFAIAFDRDLEDLLHDRGGPGRIGGALWTDHPKSVPNAFRAQFCRPFPDAF